MTEREFKQLLALHDTYVPVEQRPVYELLQEQAHAHPERTAVVACDRTLSYGQMNAETNAIGHALAELGAGPESMVVVFADRNSWAYVMRQGVLAAGAAFVPVDPEYPEERVRYILEDSGARIVLTTSAVLERRADLFAALSDLGLAIVEATEAVRTHDTSDLDVAVAPDNLAYVIYTSGSTGKPKGVMIENHNLTNFVHDDDVNIEAQVFTRFGGVSLALAAFTFDVSVMEEFLPLANGKTVVIATQDQIMDPTAMAELIAANGVCSFTCTPSYLANMIELPVFAEACKQIRAVDVGAEAFPGDLYTRLKAINPDMAVMNSYGPTECTVSATAIFLDSGDDVTIGVPLANYHAITVDEQANPLAIGEQGELVILGDGVGRGYVGRPDLNERNFIELFGIPAYRTGDLAVVRPDGLIAFHGRLDDQVKLRGLRVELGEVEKVLESFPGVRQAVVTVVKDAQEYLAAHFVADCDVDVAELKRHAKRSLTSYMVPQSFMQLDAFPLTPNGKVDKRALPEAELDYSDIVAATNAVQERLLDIVKGILGTDRVGITSDLFETGLSSLGAIRFCAELREAFNVVIKTSQLAEYPTIEDVERLLGATEQESAYELQEDYPLSETQQGIYVECMRHPEDTIYNLPMLYHLDDGVDIERLCDAIHSMVLAHPYLFMCVRTDDKGLLRSVRRDDHPFEVKVVTCEQLPAQDDLVRPFDLTSGELLCRAEVYLTQAGNYLYLDAHHIVSDGASIDIMVRDIERIYQGEEVPREVYSGYEYALDEAKVFASERHEAAHQFYDSIFAGCGGETNPVRDGSPDAGHARFERTRGKADGNAVRAYCEEHGLTLNAFFTAAFAVALKAYTYAEQPYFSTIYNGRNDPRLQDSVSMLVKTLPVTLSWQDDDYVVSLIEQCKAYLVSAMAHDIYGFSEIHQAYGFSGDVLFVYQGEFEHAVKLGGHEAPSVMLELSYARTACGIDLMLDGGELVFETEYDPSQFSPYTMAGLRNLMDHVVAEFLTKERLRDISFTGEEDEAAIRALHDSDWPVEQRPAYRLVQDQAAARPDATALVACDRTLSYAQLNAEANAVGHALVEAGACPDTMVAVMADRDSWAYVMRQGVLKAGAAFLPIDPAYPEERVRYILEDSGCKLLLATAAVLERRAELLEQLADLGLTVVEATAAVGSNAQDNLDVEVSPDDLAYVIYTSGSTGRPKGVMIENRNLVNFVDDDDKNHEILGYTRRGHASLAVAALTFDFAIMEEFVPLANGMTVVLATQEQIMSPVALAKLMADNGVDVMSCTPSYLSNMLDVPAFQPAVAALRTVDMGAEAFPPGLFERLREVNPDIHVMNGYGPTEATISCTMQVVDGAGDITIGIPNVNVHVATVDRDGRLQPLGATGELLILGEGVGRGYVGREDLTARSFVRRLGMPAYRSGDLARIREDGQIEYRGRIDDQVKLRGLRIELGEVEGVLNSYPGVRTSVAVVAHGETDFLAAYFTADGPVDIADLRAHMGAYLTAYMVPQAIMQLDEMPLTANGKVDKKALPEAVIAAEDIVPPENELQELILSFASEVIGTGTELGITTDLFATGLSSIGCIRLCALLSDEFGVSVKVADVFGCATVREIEQLVRASGVATDYELRETYPLSQTQMGIFVECLRMSGSTAYNIPLFYQLDSRVDVARLRAALRSALLAHPYLFMTIRQDDEGNVLAVRNDAQDFEVPLYTELPAREQLVRPFDLLSGEPLFRAELFDTAEGAYLLLDTHHIVSDGASLDILLEDINAAYEGAELTPESYTGFECALDEEGYRASERLAEAQAFFDGIFRGCGGDTLPVKDGSASGEGNGLLRLELPYAERVRAYCETHEVTPNAFFTTAFGFALKAYTAAEDDAVFASIYNGRNDTRLERSVTMLVKTLPVAFSADAQTPVMDAIRHTQGYLTGVMAHDIFSFAEISRTYGIAGDILFAYQGDDPDAEDELIAGYAAQEIDLDLSRAKAGMDIDVFMEGDKVILECSYDPAEYSAYTVRGLLHTVATVGEEFTKHETLADVRLTDADDEAAIRALHDSDWPVEQRPAYRLVQDQAAAKPDALALVACDRTLSYAQLNAEANAVGHALAAQGVEPESMVAVMADRDSWAYVMRQGVLKAGAAFLPIDPGYPEERVRYILEDSGCKLLLATASVLERRAELLGQLADLGLTVVEATAAVGSNAQDNLDVAVSPDNLAYVIYTSGSTGRPKGVMLTNRNLVNFVDDDDKNHEILGYTRRGHASLAIAALTFDFAIMEEFVPLANGMTVVLATSEQIMDPLALARLMTDNAVDVMSCTPSYLSNMLDIPQVQEAVRGLASIDFGAEAFPPALFTRLREVNPGLHVMNGYGPTEATISCTMQVVDGSDAITIGIPNVNVHVATVDRDGRLQPLGATGELAILGEGVGRGYVGRDDLTAHSFVRLLDMPAYRSGDLARIREDGQIEYRGRIDDQVKLRGLRVELGEIEGVLNSFEGVRTSKVVVAHGQTDYLAAYFTADTPVDTGALKAHLAAYLASYMVPQAYLQLDEMPLTANGKVDKKALPAIQEAREAKSVKAAATELQQKLLDIFKKALGLEDVGVDESFFELGGTSLTAAKVMMAGMVQDIPLTYQDIFDAPTVEGLEQLVLAKQEADQEAAQASDAPDAPAEGLSGVEKALAYNVSEYVDEIKPGGGVGDVLLTGGTGFLGAHVLHELLTNHDGVVYCLVRSHADASAENHLRTAMFYYFEMDIRPYLGKRVVVVEGDITNKDSLRAAFAHDFQTVFNCAASVKHFADFSFLKSINVDGVKNLADLCLETGRRLIHVSTVSVAGDVVGVDAHETTLTENLLEIGQDVVSNGYIHTKFLAEKAVLEMVGEQGLDAKVMRVGNLMSRQVDGEFQMNFNTNNFMATLKSHVALGCFPMSEMDEQDEFSPIDETARAIVLLAGTDRKFTVFHPHNSHTVEMGNIIRAMQECGLAIDVVDDERFSARLREALADDAINAYVSPLVNYNLDDDEIRFENPSSNRFTIKALYRLGFQWSITETRYLNQAIEMMQMLGFFDME